MLRPNQIINRIFQIIALFTFIVKIIISKDMEPRNYLDQELEFEFIPTLKIMDQYEGNFFEDIIDPDESDLMITTMSSKKVKFPKTLDIHIDLQMFPNPHVNFMPQVLSLKLRKTSSFQTKSIIPKLNVDRRKEFTFYVREANSSIKKMKYKVPDCFYQGYLSALPNANSSSKLSKNAGITALSLCQGMEGIVQSSFGTFTIQPNNRKSINNTNKFDKNSLTVKHTLKKIKIDSSTDSNIEEIADHKSLLNYRRRQEKKFCGVDIDKSKNRKGSFQIDLKELESNEGKGKEENMRTMFDRKFGLLKTKSFTIKTAIFLDSFLYDQLIKKGFKTEKDILFYIFTVFNGVQLFYSDVSLGVPINLVLSHFEIMKEKRPELMHERVTHLLEAFGNFQKRLNRHNIWDVAILMTGLDVYAISKRLGPLSDKVTIAKAILGYAYVGSMCDAKYSVTISEGKGFKPVFTITHELGHTLGLEHDGKDNDCEDWKYIMASRLAPGISTWSTCSKARISKFIHHFPCLREPVEEREKIVEDPFPNVLPGQRVDVNEQCEAAYGKGSKWLTDPRYPLQTICQLVRCTPPHGTYIVVELLIHPALEGTYCGPNKWCQSGQCVSYPRGAIVKGGWTPWKLTHQTCRNPFIDFMSTKELTTCNAKNKMEGIRIWERECTKPIPRNGGQQCQGINAIYEKCVIRHNVLIENNISCTPNKQHFSLQNFINQRCESLSLSPEIPLFVDFYGDMVLRQPQTFKNDYHEPPTKSYFNAQWLESEGDGKRGQKNNEYRNDESSDTKSTDWFSNTPTGYKYLFHGPLYENPIISNSLQNDKFHRAFDERRWPSKHKSNRVTSKSSNPNNHWFVTTNAIGSSAITSIPFSNRNVLIDGGIKTTLKPNIDESACSYQCFDTKSEQIKSYNLPNGSPCQLAKNSNDFLTDVFRSLNHTNHNICVDGRCEPISKQDGSWGPFTVETDCQNKECLYNSVNLKVFKRTCVDPPPLNGGRPCQGGNVLYQICQDKLMCRNKRKGSSEYASTVCHLISKLPHYHFLTGEGIQFLHINQRFRCAIWCKTKSGGMISPSSLYFPDGTNCRRYNERSKSMFCLRRTCVEFKKNGKPFIP